MFLVSLKTRKKKKKKKIAICRSFLTSTFYKLQFFCVIHLFFVGPFSLFLVMSFDLNFGSVLFGFRMWWCSECLLVVSEQVEQLQLIISHANNVQHQTRHTLTYIENIGLHSHYP